MKHVLARLVTGWVVVVVGMGAQDTGQRQESPATPVDPYTATPRLLVLTDIANEPDDQMSMVRLLVYANQLDIAGLVATTSTWMKNAVRPDVIRAAGRRLRAGAAESGRADPGLPAGVAVACPRQHGAADLRHGRGRPGQDIAGLGPDRPRGRSAGSRPLWITIWGAPTLWRRRSSDVARNARHGGPRPVRLEAAGLLHLRPGRCRSVDTA